MTREPSSDVLSPRLGYLLKHVHRRFTVESARALAPYGLDGRDLAVLAVLEAQAEMSQLDAARELGIDRTTMVALVDALEEKGLVRRSRSHLDRRKNVVGLTPLGKRQMKAAEATRQDMERRFLAPLSNIDATRLVRALQIILRSSAVDE